MLGVLIVILRRDDVAGSNFAFGEFDISLIASLRILKAIWLYARAVRIPAFGAAVKSCG